MTAQCKGSWKLGTACGQCARCVEALLTWAEAAEKSKREVTARYCRTISKLEDQVDTLSARLAEVEAREVALKSAAHKAQWALQPFSDCITNDNGDLTFTVPYWLDMRSRFVDAHFAYKAIRAAFSTDAQEKPS